jgi:protein NUD1
MDQWLDCLTEDWISEPLSARSNSVKRIMPSSSSSSPKSNLSQSRIPRYKARSTSNLSVGDTDTPKRRSSGQTDRRTATALSESSSSNLNAPHPHGPRGASNRSSPLVRPSGKRAGSAGSLSFVPQDTVQHKPPRPSSAKDADLQNTPDWKRRILQGKVAPGDQCDLFSPIGLEKVFRPPSAGTEGKFGRGITAKCRQPEDYPSSPPFPSVLKESRVITPHDREHPKTPVSPTKRNVKTEADECDHQGALRAVAGNQNPIESGSKKQSRVSNLSRRNTSRPDSAKAPPSKSACVKRQDRSSSATPSNISSCINHNQLPNQGLDSSIQQDYRDENISPFFVSRHQTIDGRIDYAAIDMSMDQLRCQMDKLRLRQQSMPSSRSSDNGIDYTEAKSPEESLLPEFENDWTSHSLPDDLSMGTDAFVANGGFVNLRRGGYSNDGSFQERPLSPSSLPALEISESRSIAPSSRYRRSESPVAVFPSTTPVLPTTPRQREPKEQSSPARTQSSGSPLKLFDKYDTFTKDRVSRRMSKFEENLCESPDQEATKYDYEKSGSHSKVSKYSMLEARQNEIYTKSYQRNERRMNSFGEGELDSHSFCSSQPSKRSVNPAQGDWLHFENKEGDSSGSRFDQEMPPGFPMLRIASNNNLGILPTSVPHNPVKAISYHSQKSMTPTNRGASSALINQEIPKEDVHNAQGKRLPRSPVKDSQPKRQRTLRHSDDAECRPRQASLNIKVKIPPLNSVVGRKRKDALYDGQNQVADPEILAMRTILRPRTSTTSHDEFSDRGIHVNTLINIDDAEIKTGISAQGEPVLRDPPTAAVVKQPASFTLDMVQNETKGSRKASVNTADFFNEAQQIMRVIRAQGRPQSNQESIQEVEPYHQAVFESVVEESPKDEFSRPPSRAGASLRRLREPVQFDARVVSHLRKFEEKGDFETAFSSSFKAIHLGKLECEPFDPKTGSIDLEDENVVESDPPNVRIYRQLSQQDSKKLLPIEDPPSLSTDTKSRSLGSLASGPSTGRSLHTRSSHGSGTKAMIVPETVSHLLSDQIAGMKYDQERQVWIKSPVKEILKPPYQTSSEMTEDVLGEIPDLSVDELEEMQRIKDRTGSFNKLSPSPNSVSNHDDATCEVKPCVKKDDEDARPRTAEGAISASDGENSSARSKFSRLASSGPIPETRATSWGGDVSPAKQQGTLRWDQQSPAAENDGDHEDHEDHEGHEGDHEGDYEEDHDHHHDEEVEHEISILEGRSSKTPTRSNRRGHQARVVTVSFSSPLVGQIETPHPPEGEAEIWEDGSDLDLDDSPIRFKPHPGAPSSRRRSSFERRSGRRTSSRRVSINHQSYIARPMSRLDEEDETAFLRDSHGFRKSSMNVIISTPLSPPRSLLAPDPPSNEKHSSIGFHLSPLQDFSVHQIDKSTDQGYGDVVRRRGLLSAHEIGKFALVTQHLVQKLTDIEPYEPYWNLIQRMNLQNQGLITLHKLDGFCSRLEELNVSNNSLSQLDGAPSSIRDLKICRNNLSDLSAWGHLQNLQYLDVSQNHIRTFKGFHRLVHLRELNADDNEIDSLDGLFQLDGLLSLRLRGNLVRSIDFHGSNL